MAERVSLRKRILRELSNGPITGEHVLGARVLGDRYTIDDYKEFKELLKYLCMPAPDVIETRRQIPGTGANGPPVFESVFSLPGQKIDE